MGVTRLALGLGVALLCPALVGGTACGAERTGWRTKDTTPRAGAPEGMPGARETRAPEPGSPDALTRLAAERGSEREEIAGRPSESSPEPTADAESSDALPGIGFEFVGNTAFTDHTLRKTLAKYQGQPMNEATLREIEGEITRHYLGAGRLARTHAELVDGVVTVLVAEIGIGSINCEGYREPGSQYDKGFIESHFDDLSGRPWWGRLWSRLLILRQYPGLDGVSAVVRRGGRDPSITINLKEKKVDAWGSVEFDNFGSVNTAQERFSERVHYPCLAGRGDVLSLQVLHGVDLADALYGDLSYTIPTDTRGTRLRLYVAGGDFEIGRALSILDLSGTALSCGASVTHPLRVSHAGALQAEFGLDLDNTDFDFGMGPGTFSRDRVRKVRIGFTRDWWPEGGAVRNSAAICIHQGLGELFGGTGRQDPASRACTDNSFTKLTFAGESARRVSSHALLTAALSAQASFDPLLTGEQMSIGGANSVRGFSQGEFIGDSGVLVNVEYSQRLDALARDLRLRDLEGVAFVDHGSVFLHTPRLGENRSSHATGVGLGLRAEFEHDMSLRVDLGYAVCGEPQSGGRLKPYVQLVQRF